MSADPDRLVLEGSAFGVNIWRDADTGDLLATRGASEPQPLDWPQWAANHPDSPEVAAAAAWEEESERLATLISRVDAGDPTLTAEELAEVEADQRRTLLQEMTEDELAEADAQAELNDAVWRLAHGKDTTP